MKTHRNLIWVQYGPGQTTQSHPQWMKMVVTGTHCIFAISFSTIFGSLFLSNPWKETRSASQGKTLAFVLPILESLTNGPAKESRKTGYGRSPTVLVLLSTRELATQVFAEFEVYGGALGLSSACVYGGASFYSQEIALRRGADIVVGTPGRIKGYTEIKNRSLLTSLENYVTLLLQAGRPIYTPSFAFSVLRRFLPDEKVEQLKGLSLTADGKGAVFDVPAADVDLFIAGQENASMVSLEVLTELPPLQDKEQSRGALFRSAGLVFTQFRFDLLQPNLIQTRTKQRGAARLRRGRGPIAGRQPEENRRLLQIRPFAAAGDAGGLRPLRLARKLLCLSTDESSQKSHLGTIWTGSNNPESSTADGKLSISGFASNREDADHPLHCNDSLLFYIKAFMVMGE
ncbi:hypothetical protein MRB53_021257 [Persea americana]|uniref:Uncharacterized protein n=1 Tax=Persea americana TaxID=3435 RepID=A0ACC2L3W3_PERAE|nr:hypothetical protein MRB53_021257 [Persea americana]